MDRPASEVELLPVTASACGVKTVPMPILHAMFDKANSLLQTSGNVIPKPGASDGSFIVSGHSNTIHIVTPGKGGSLKCDRACVNCSTNICEHVLAVAQVRGTFMDFLNWYKKSKRGPKLVEIALKSGPKNAGKKPSRRKRTNKERPSVTRVVDLLEQNDFAQTPVPVTTFPPSVMPVQQAPGSRNIPSAPATLHPPSSGPTAPPSTIPVQLQPTLANGINIPFAPVATFPTSSVPIVGSGYPPANAISTPGQIQFQNNFGHNNMEMFNPQGIDTGSDQSNVFRLKWLVGTRVSRCYGCQGVINNPPESVPDDLIVVYRDIREYRERNTGQLQYSPAPQNVHFHLRASCIRRRYPSFPGASALTIPSDFIRHFRLEHIQRLYSEFGWTP